MGQDTEIIRPRITITDAELVTDAIGTIQMIPGLRDHFTNDEMAALEDMKLKFRELILLAQTRATIRDLRS